MVTPLADYQIDCANHRPLHSVDEVQIVSIFYERQFRIALVTQVSLRTSVNLPITAAVAAIAGLTRCVRAPGPCRPTKFRLLVLAHRSPGGTLSGFMPRQVE